MRVSLHLRQNPATPTQCRQNHLQHHRQQVLLSDCRNQTMSESAHNQEQRRDARRPYAERCLYSSKEESVSHQARPTISVWRAIFYLIDVNCQKPVVPLRYK